MSHTLRGATSRSCRSDPFASRKLRRDLGIATLGGFVLALEVAEDGARIDAEVARGLGPVAVVEGEDLVDVVALELLLRVGEGKDGRQLIGREIEILGGEQG